MKQYMKIFMKFLNIILKILKDYCLNSCVIGLRYIASEKYHITEKIFWLICLLSSVYGSYHLIREYQETFESNAISMVIEELNINEKIQFPSIGICELGNIKSEYPNLEEVVQSLNRNESMEYNVDVEEFLLRIIFQNIYSSGSLKPFCEPYMDCKDCTKCPMNEYENFAKKVRANCTELFEKCIWRGESFDCCEYFLPLKTTMGECYLLNSIQTTNKKSPHWLDMNVGFEIGNSELKLITTKTVSVHILNEEDVPHMILTTLKFTQQNPGYEGIVTLNLQNIINDLSVHDVHPKYRKCIFPEENYDGTIYKYYSFSGCITECLKRVQLEKCNCTNYNMIVNENDKIFSCDYNGFICLDLNDIMFPHTTMLQPWRSNSLTCSCQPSCNEHEIKIVERTFRIDPNSDKRSIIIKLQSLPTERYRRQAVRTQLDIVVSIGGILSLFMGASVLSGIELLSLIFIRTIENLILATRFQK